MTDAPERIWAAYPDSGRRVDGTIYGYDVVEFDPKDETPDDWDDPCSSAQYVRKDLYDAQAARIAELEVEVEHLSQFLIDAKEDVRSQADAAKVLLNNQELIEGIEDEHCKGVSFAVAVGRTLRKLGSDTKDTPPQ